MLPQLCARTLTHVELWAASKADGSHSSPSSTDNPNFAQEFSKACAQPCLELELVSVPEIETRNAWQACASKRGQQWSTSHRYASIICAFFVTCGAVATDQRGQHY